MKNILFLVTFLIGIFSNQCVFSATEKLHRRSAKTTIITNNSKKMSYLKKMVLKKITKQIAKKNNNSLEGVAEVLVFLLGIPLLVLFFLWIGTTLWLSILLTLLLSLLGLAVYGFLTMNVC